MQAKVLVSLNPFPVPETVTLAPTVQKPKSPQQAFAPSAPSWAKAPEAPPPVAYWQIPLADLDPETLHRLCEEFRDTVFFKADKPQPPEAVAEIDKSPALRAFDKLRAVLCDPEGAVCVVGEVEDREAIAEALDSLATFVVRL